MTHGKLAFPPHRQSLRVEALVDPGSSDQAITVSAPTDENVIAEPAEQPIPPRLSEQLVGAAPSLQEIAVVASEELIPPSTTEQPITTGPAPKS